MEDDNSCIHCQVAFPLSTNSRFPNKIVGAYSDYKRPEHLAKRYKNYNIEEAMKGITRSSNRYRTPFRDKKRKERFEEICPQHPRKKRRYNDHDHEERRNRRVFGNHREREHDSSYRRNNDRRSNYNSPDLGKEYSGEQPADNLDYNPSEFNQEQNHGDDSQSSIQENCSQCQLDRNHRGFHDNLNEIGIAESNEYGHIPEDGTPPPVVNSDFGPQMSREAVHREPLRRQSPPAEPNPSAKRQSPPLRESTQIEGSVTGAVSSESMTPSDLDFPQNSENQTVDEDEFTFEDEQNEDTQEGSQNDVIHFIQKNRVVGVDDMSHSEDFSSEHHEVAIGASIDENDPGKKPRPSGMSVDPKCSCLADRNLIVKQMVQFHDWLMKQSISHRLEEKHVRLMMMDGIVSFDLYNEMCTNIKDIMHTYGCTVGTAMKLWKLSGLRKKHQNRSSE